MSKTEDFIQRAKLVHGDKYDYSKVEYINNKTKVIIICPEHSEFEQTPNNHLNGKGCSKCAGRGFNYLPFEEAKNFVRNLNLKSQKEWNKYCISGNKPNNIPSSPINTYKDEWINMGDWLGTFTVATYNMKFLPFEEARNFVRNINLKSLEDWKKYCKSRNKPNNIPSNPYKIYKEWINMGDWLGTFTVATYNMKFLSFEEARNFVRNLNLKSQIEYRKYCKSGNKPNNIPSNPHNTYKDGWVSYGDWLGTLSVHTKEFLPFEEARKYVHTLNINTSKEWFIFCKTADKPNDIPTHPRMIYKNEWISMGDWLGTFTIASKNMIFLPFEEARNFVRNLNLKSQREWSEYCISGNKPNNIPSSPINTYKDEWIDMGDWLGTFVVASKNIHENYLSYDEAKIFIKKLSVKSVNEYFNWWDENKPDFLPKHPDTYYKKIL